MVVFTQDKQKLLAHFRKDPVLFAYHIGDLDDFYFADCQWGATYGQSPRIDDVILVYSGLETAAVLAFGVSERFEALLADMLDILPDRFFCHFQRQYRDRFLVRYDEKPLGTHLKMKLGEFQSVQSGKSPNIKRLDRSHLESLKRLYQDAYPENYFHERMLETGKYFGYFDSDDLAAVAGVHVCSDEYDIAVLGNIATEPGFRDRGLGTAVTSRLVSELVDENKLVCLNVKADNEPAVRSYKRLGFVPVHEYEEARFTRKD
jgi:ribosomal protein S18 acetylase RimI-like enzyme